MMEPKTCTSTASRTLNISTRGQSFKSLQFATSFKALTCTRCRICRFSYIQERWIVGRCASLGEPLFHVSSATRHANG